MNKDIYTWLFIDFILSWTILTVYTFRFPDEKDE